jgi:hypothetical protein
VADESLLAAAIDLERWLRADRERPYEMRLHRDREIGREIDFSDPVRRVLSWWQEINARDLVSAVEVDEHADGARVIRLRNLVTLVLLLGGLAVGGFVCSAALSYDGRYPVNLLMLFGVLVGVPGVLLLVTLLALPGWIPGSRAVADVFSSLNPSRWALSWLGRAGGLDGRSATSIDPSIFNAGRYASVTRWQLVAFSQWFAVGFFTGALATAWLLVAFTDLAFGWSTTLKLAAEDVHRFFFALALPWAGWLPAAVPEPALTEASQYVRLASVHQDAGEAARLGDWWPFVLMVVLVYGMLPRLVLLMCASWRLRIAIHRWVLNNVDVTALLDRLDSPSVTYDADPEAAPEEMAGLRLSPLPEAAQGTVQVLVWNDAMSTSAAGDFLREQLGLSAGAIGAFSVLDSAEIWEEKLAELGSNMAAIGRLVVISKGWEPPLLEFVDFLKLVREKFPDVSVAVAPVDITGRAIVASERDVWARTLSRLNDPKLYVLAAAGVVSG